VVYLPSLTYSHSCHQHQHVVVVVRPPLFPLPPINQVSMHTVLHDVLNVHPDLKIDHCSFSSTAPFRTCLHHPIPRLSSPSTCQPLFPLPIVSHICTMRSSSFTLCSMSPPTIFKLDHCSFYSTPLMMTKCLRNSSQLLVLLSVLTLAALVDLSSRYSLLPYSA
jgi:hypothetical protein